MRKNVWHITVSVDGHGRESGRIAGSTDRRAPIDSVAGEHLASEFLLLLLLILLLLLLLLLFLLPLLCFSLALSFAPPRFAGRFYFTSIRLDHGTLES